MKATVLEAFGGPDVLAPSEVPRPVAMADEMLVRITACGVCGHDVLARAGRLGGSAPRILGHEIVGVVEVAGRNVAGFAGGERVVLSQRRSCGTCRACREARSNHCTQGPGFYGEQLAGGYAEYVVADVRNAVRLPPEVSDLAAAALPCGVVTALHATRRLCLSAGEVVAVVGAGGGVGIHAVELARLHGARVIALTHRPEKARRLEDTEADAVVVADGDGAATAVRAAAGGPVDAVIDCAGATLPVSLRMLRHGGRLALLGNIAPGGAGLEAGLLILKEIDLLGSSHGTVAELELAVQLVAEGRIDPVIAATFPLAEAADAHRLLASGTAVGRVILTVKDEAVQSH